MQAQSQECLQLERKKKEEGKRGRKKKRKLLFHLSEPSLYNKVRVKLLYSDGISNKRKHKESKKDERKKLLIQLTFGVLCLEGIPSSIAMASLSCFSIV